MSGKPTRRVWVMVVMALVVISQILTLTSGGVSWIFPVALIVAAVAVGVWAWRGSPQRPNKRIF